MKLQRFNNFLENSILESVVNESIIYFSPDVKGILQKMDNVIAKEILNTEATDVKPDITFVDLGEEGYLSFITMRNAKKLIEDKFPRIKDIDTKPDLELAEQLFSLDKVDRGAGILTNSRNSVGLGKFVNKLFPGKFNDKDRETFVNLFKSTLEKTGERFELVDKDLIGMSYDKNNYLEIGGTLGSSCMNSKPPSYFEIYINNPEVCKLLVLKDENGKILGRALVWKLESCKELRTNNSIDTEWFMDRQYTIKDSDVNKFRKYATDKGWSFKSYNNHHTFHKINFKGTEFEVDMKIKIKGGNYGRYPYMDTFRRYDPFNGKLFNDDEREGSEGQYILESTSGSYEEIESGVYSEYHDRRIPEDRAVWSERLGDYLEIDSAVEVTGGSRRYRGWYPDGDDDVVYDDWNGQYIHIDESVYSEFYGYSLLADEAVECVTDVGSDDSIDSYDWMHQDDDKVVYIGNKNWYEKLCEKFSEWKDYTHILRDITTQTEDGPCPEAISITVYKISGTLEGVDRYDLEDEDIHLLEVDANLLGYEIDGDEDMTIDKFTYHDEIESLIPTIKRRLRAKIEEINNQIEDRGQLYIKGDDDEEFKKGLKKKLKPLVEREELLEEFL
jgi:hypothetical protein